MFLGSPAGLMRKRSQVTDESLDYLNGLGAVPYGAYGNPRAGTGFAGAPAPGTAAFAAATFVRSPQGITTYTAYPANQPGHEETFPEIMPQGNAPAQFVLSNSYGQTVAFGGMRYANAYVPNPAYTAYVQAQADPIPAIQSWAQAANNQDGRSNLSPYAFSGYGPVYAGKAGVDASVQNFPVNWFIYPGNGKKYYYVPNWWYAGGGGHAQLSADVAASKGGRAFTLGTPAADNMQSTGYIFDHNPVNEIGAPGTGSALQYTPGVGSQLKQDIGPIVAIAALPFVAAAITAVAAGGAAAGAGAGAGAVMPGAEAVASGATGGILTSGAGAAATTTALETAGAAAIMPGAEALATGATGGLVTGGATAAGTAAATTGLTTAGVVGAVKSAVGVVSAISTVSGAVSKISALVGQHSDAANALATQAQTQADAGRIAAAAALQDQANKNAQAAAYYQSQMPGFLNMSIYGVPLWAVALAGVGAVGLIVTTRKGKK